MRAAVNKLVMPTMSQLQHFGCSVQGITTTTVKCTQAVHVLDNHDTVSARYVRCKHTHYIN